MEKWKVVAVEPEKEPYEAEMTFGEIQRFVGGDAEQIALYDDKVALANEEGRLKNLEHNRHMILQDKGHLPLTILGNFVVVKSGEQEYESLNEEEVKEAKFIYRSTSKDATIFI
ncbi:hypothetical protein CVD28_00465 [Bacillus sp. M6-12]|uniref:DUF3846 domain-containing protein n=1 Tax=Bacillus sp. M6-12 TaxID=2054166 RepID=UPI000C76757F|nr:DUF3846 domain-containing protein [Bacillus sp. M6-12]PLS18907.1 hypothetical protein CVD28_00465 [Bacillus sp. M6-12]